MNQIPNRLLVIDDEAAICDFIGTVAKRIGYEVRATDDPDEFFSLLDDFKPSTLIIDLNMPKVDGIKLLGILGDKQYQGAIMVISGAESRVLAAAQKSGTSHGLKMLGVVQKPVSLSDLRDALQGARTMQRVVTESDLREALETGQLTIHYQAIVARQGNDEWRIVGAEALARWQHPEFGLLKSDEFITLAEEAGLISAVTDYVLRTVVEQMYVWHGAGMDVGISVNVASELMSDPDFPDRLMVLFEEYRVDSSKLTIEVSECTAMQAGEQDIDILARLRLKGVQLSIDNFGTGHSSLSQLFRLPFSELKMDRLFVMEISSDAEARAIVKASINLAHNLNMCICATGVHSQEIWDFLDAEGCDKAQGYFFSKPVSAASFEKLFRGTSGIAGAENPDETVPAVGS